MLDTFFGFGVTYGVDHKTPSVAMNSRLDTFEVHGLSDDSNDLYLRYGSWNGPTITWLNQAYYDKGVDPAVAVNRKYVVEVHNSQRSGYTDDLWIHVGEIADPIDFGEGEQYDTGRFAGIAVTDLNVILEVHRHPDKDKLYYCYGTTDGKSFSWKQKGINFADGNWARVAMNSLGVAVMAWELDQEVFTAVCSVGPDSVTVGAAKNHGIGHKPTVALTDDGRVVLVYEVPPDMYFDLPLQQQLFRVSNGALTAVGDPHVFDSGIRASVAANGSVTVQVHQYSESTSELLFSNALLVDGASWMRDRLDLLSEVPLRLLVLPASHDSAMYRTDGLEFLGQTQDLSITNQLNYGIRWFDLRPFYDSGTNTIYLWHGQKDGVYVTGPTLAEVLDQMSGFLDTHQELVILKFSHFRNFDDATYKQLADQIVQVLGSWLVEKTPNGKRLADVTLDEYISADSAALVVLDQKYFYKNRTPGLWFYRNWSADDAANGDLRVYDEYAGTTSYADLKADQIGKFENYNGMCEDPPNGNVPCDLFLLSWTLTPLTAVWLYASDPDRYLGEVVMTEMVIPNAHGKIVNLLYVDYAEFARVTDVALWLAGVEVPANK